MYESWQVSSHKSVKPTLLFGSVQKVDLASCIQASSTPLIGQWGYVSFWRMPRWPDVPGQIEVKQSAAESGSTLNLLAILWGPSILASWIKYLTCVCVWMCSRPRYVCVPACWYIIWTWCWGVCTFMRHICMTTNMCGLNIWVWCYFVVFEYLCTVCISVVDVLCVRVFWIVCCEATEQIMSQPDQFMVLGSYQLVVGRARKARVPAQISWLLVGSRWICTVHDGWPASLLCLKCIGKREGNRPQGLKAFCRIWLQPKPDTPVFNCNTERLPKAWQTTRSMFC